MDNTNKPQSKAEIIKSQTRKIAALGVTNMFDYKKVFELAVEYDYNELANFIFEHTPLYSKLILTGKVEGVDD
jgi:hypothetical protein